MDDLDRAISQTTGDTQTTSTTPAPTRSVAPLILVGVVVLVIGVIYITRSAESPAATSDLTPVPDDQVMALDVTRTPLKPKLVSAQFAGKVYGASWGGRMIAVCPASEGQIVMQDDRPYLQCPKTKVKQLTVTESGTFEERFKAGTYLINAQLHEGESTRDLPARIDLTTGMRNEISITIH